MADICQSLLSTARTDADRQLVRQRNIAFNQVLADECATYSRCRFDGNAVFETESTRSDVSTLDYFHPSLTGQARLASITWGATWWGSTRPGGPDEAPHQSCPAGRDGRREGSRPLR